MKGKKWLAVVILLIGVMSVFGLTGCGDSTNKEEAQKEAASQAEQAAKDTKEAAKDAKDNAKDAADTVKSDLEGFNNGDVVKEGVTVEGLFIGLDKQAVPEKDDDDIDDNDADDNDIDDDNDADDNDIDDDNDADDNDIDDDNDADDNDADDNDRNDVNGDMDQVDTVWVYYSDKTFEQFADLDNKVVLFSIGNYELKEDADFNYNENEEDHGKIQIDRTKKYSKDKGLNKHVSSHEYGMDEIREQGYIPVYSPDEGKKVVTVFFGPDKQPLEEIDADDNETEKEMVDTWWIYYDDGTFDQYAQIHDQVVLFSTGTYKFKEDGGFIYDAKDGYPGKIQIDYTKQYKDGEGLVEHKFSRTDDLNSLGFDQLFVIK